MAPSGVQGRSPGQGVRGASPPWSWRIFLVRSPCETVKIYTKLHIRVTNSVQKKLLTKFWIFKKFTDKQKFLRTNCLQSVTILETKNERKNCHIHTRLFESQGPQTIVYKNFIRISVLIFVLIFMLMNELTVYFESLSPVIQSLNSPFDIQKNWK